MSQDSDLISNVLRYMGLSKQVLNCNPLEANKALLKCVAYKPTRDSLYLNLIDLPQNVLTVCYYIKKSIKMETK